MYMYLDLQTILNWLKTCYEKGGIHIVKIQKNNLLRDEFWGLFIYTWCQTFISREKNHCHRNNVKKKNDY